MDSSTFLFLFLSGIIGGAINAIAGGGTLITFPAMMLSGLDPLTANVSNAVAIYPGHLAAVPAYQKEIRAAGRPLMARSLVVALGGFLGASMLLKTGSAIFISLVPWLMLASTLLFAFGPAMASISKRIHPVSRCRVSAIEFLFATYGGYFGAGLGVLIMAALTIVGIKDVQMANAQKNWLATIITTISVIVFSVVGAVAWPQTFAVLLGALVGGYVGACFARRISAGVLRTAVICVGFALSIYYFAQ